MTTASFLGGRVTVHAGDCLDVLRTIPDASVDSIVTDPPYALASIVKRFGGANAAPAKGGVYARASAGFMGKEWDTGETAFAVEFWREVYRVLKPGGHVAAFGGTRTCHHLTTAIEGAGFEIRDRLTWIICADTHVAQFLASLSEEQQRAFVRCIEESRFGGELSWVFGSGFPKSHDVAKGIGAKLLYDHGGGSAMNRASAPGGRTPEAAEWQGWGTALKPALEPIALARKPLIGTVAENVLAHGTGAINVDACRVGQGETRPGRSNVASRSGLTGTGGAVTYGAYGVRGSIAVEDTTIGRWPANVLHDGSDEVMAAFPLAAGQQAAVTGQEPSAKTNAVYGAFNGRPATAPRGDTGSAARFFYSAKADTGDRAGSKHPTVKPVSLMRWLVRLVTPPGGIVMDPFAGTGTTGEAAYREGFRAILCEREEEYRADIARRMALVLAGPDEKRHAIVRARGKVEAPGGLFAFLGDAAE